MSVFMYHFSSPPPPRSYGRWSSLLFFCFKSCVKIFLPSRVIELGCVNLKSRIVNWCWARHSNIFSYLWIRMGRIDDVCFDHHYINYHSISIIFMHHLGIFHIVFVVLCLFIGGACLFYRSLVFYHLDTWYADILWT